MHRQEDEEEEENTATHMSNGSAGLDDDANQPLPRNRSGVKHKLHTATAYNKHHKSLSTSTLLSSPSPSTALTPSSSATLLVHHLATHLNQLNSHSHSTIDTLRSTAATSSLLPTFQYELDAYQAAFLSAASSLTTPIRQLSSHYSNKLEDAADESRSLSYRVSTSLSQLSSSAAGTASERIHSVYATYNSLQSEHDNCQLLAAVASRLRATLERLQLVKQQVDEEDWLDTVRSLDAVRDSCQQLLAFDPHMATSAVYRLLMVTR